MENFSKFEYKLDDTIKRLDELEVHIKSNETNETEKAVIKLQLQSAIEDIKSIKKTMSNVGLTVVTIILGALISTAVTILMG